MCFAMRCMWSYCSVSFFVVSMASLTCLTISSLVRTASTKLEPSKTGRPPPKICADAIPTETITAVIIIDLRCSFICGFLPAERTEQQQSIPRNSYRLPIAHTGEYSTGSDTSTRPKYGPYESLRSQHRAPYAIHNADNTYSFLLLLPIGRYPNLLG